jgi:hypothetical protein
MATHNPVYAKDRPDIHTSIDVTAAVEGIEHNAVFTPVLLLDDDGFFVLFGDEHSGPPGCTKSIYHDIVREHIEFLLLFTLDVGLSGKTDSTLEASVERAQRQGLGAQINKSSFANIRCNKL